MFKWNIKRKRKKNKWYQFILSNSQSSIHRKKKKKVETAIFLFIFFLIYFRANNHFEKWKNLFWKSQKSQKDQIKTLVYSFCSFYFLDPVLFWVFFPPNFCGSFCFFCVFLSKKRRTVRPFFLLLFSLSSYCFWSTEFNVRAQKKTENGFMITWDGEISLLEKILLWRKREWGFDGWCKIQVLRWAKKENQNNRSCFAPFFFLLFWSFKQCV